jgi:alkylation response protein AidB-like acyl-CoA dehydrogenase
VKAQPIEHQKILKIESLLEAEGVSHQDRIKRVEEYAIECSILKVAVSEDVQNCADEGIQIFGGMGFSTPWKALGEMPVSLVSMKVLTKSTECFQ